MAMLRFGLPGTPQVMCQHVRQLPADRRSKYEALEILLGHLPLGAVAGDPAAFIEQCVEAMPLVEPAACKPFVSPLSARRGGPTTGLVRKLAFPGSCLRWSVCV